MKYVLLASALMISGVAFAQADPRDAGQPIGSGATLQPGTTMGERDTMGNNAATVQPNGTVTTPQSTGNTNNAMPPAPTTTPDTTMGTTGTTGSGTVMVQQGGNMTPPPTDTGPYPRCSRTITDHCQQSSARESDTKGGPPKHRRTRR
jgi:hypothetical protein